MPRLAEQSTGPEQLGQILHDAARRLEPDQWIQSLSPRKREEVEFHNRSRDPAAQLPERLASWEREHGNKRFYDTTAASWEYTRRWIEANAPGAVLLDYACGEGIGACHAAAAGATLAIGIDISPVAIANSTRVAAERGLTDRTRFLVGDCEHTALPDASIDRVVCLGCLHHLDLSYALPELRRILKPGGTVLALEALNYNPLIRLYRRLTPHLRTEWERRHILSHRELRFARYFFEVREVRYFHLTSILTTPLRRTRLFGPALALANRVDGVLCRVPGVSLMSWMFAFELVNRDEG